MKKADPAHTLTDAEIAKVEKLITKEYKKAHKEAKKKLDDYLARFAAKDAKWQEWVADGTKTKKEWEDWRKGQMLVGKKWEDLVDTLATDYTNTAKITQSICKGHAPEVYALNHNYATFEVEKGALVDTSYTLYSRESVERMYREKPKLYHTYGKAVAKEIKEGKQYPWDKRRITSVLTQAILQGESIPKITKRLEQVTVGDHKAAIRNARTMMTGVQNAGRIDAFTRAQNLGIPVRKQWMAALDMRTRHWHRELDGEIVDVDEPFENEIGKIMFPGDPDADGANIYNCRCTLIAVIKGFEIDLKDPNVRPAPWLNGMTYDDWLKQKKSISNPIDLPEKKAANIQGAWWGKYGGGAGKTHKYAASEGKDILDKMEKDAINKQYSGIWTNKTVTPADYPGMKKAVNDKKWNLDKQINKAKSSGDAKALAKYQAQMDELLDFEKKGKKYLKDNPAAGKVPKTTAKTTKTTPKAPKATSTPKTPAPANKSAAQAPQKPLTEKKAQEAVKAAEDKLKKADNQYWPEIWKGGVKPSDYPSKKHLIDSKKQYYQSQYDKAVAKKDKLAMQKYKTNLERVNEFEKAGKAYEAAKAELDAAKKALKPFEDAKKAKEAAAKAAKEAKEKAKLDAKKASIKKEIEDLEKKKYNIKGKSLTYDEYVKLYGEKSLKTLKKYGTAEQNAVVDDIMADLKAKKKHQAALDKLEGKIPNSKSSFVNPDPKKTVANAKEYSYDWHEKNDFDWDIWKKMEDRERYGLQRYTGSSYTAMNDIMRGIRKADPHNVELINGATDAVSHYRLKEDTLLFRGMGSGKSLARSLRLPESEVRKMLNDGSIVGHVFTEDGFGSTAASERKAWYKEIMLKIHAPKNTQAMYVDPVSLNSGEREILLQRGTRFEILGVRKSSDGRYWLDVVILDQNPVKF